MRLADIIKNGTLCDNQSYSVSQGILANTRLGEIALSSKPSGSIWNFLSSTSRDIERILNKTITRTLTLFNGEEYEHNTEDSFISVTGTDASNFTLTTGNLIGFIKSNKYALKVSSRFGDAFLRYIIADADGFLEQENLGGEGDTDGYEWLLAYLWNIKLKRAYRLGLPKAYVTKKERISRVRGTIDVVDYFQNNSSGKYLCSYREHSYDSPAALLFIKAYQAVEHHTFCQETRNIYNAFLAATHGGKKSRQELLQTPYFTNPFYNDYNTLIDLSKRIISQKEADFDSQHDSSAFFFDVSMLFEYFIRKLIKRDGIHVHSKFSQRYEIVTGALSNYKRKLEPDLIFEKDGGIYVFDVKYKTFDQRYGVKREDLFQLHTYVGQYGNDATINGCGFIYPISEKRWNELNLDRTQGIISDIIHQQGKRIPFHVIFLKIPDNSFSDFNKLMSEQCRLFLDAVHSKVLGKKPIAA